jgi:hypothetical protein
MDVVVVVVVAAVESSFIVVGRSPQDVVALLFWMDER